MEGKDQLFDNMLQAALERLKGCSPEQIAKKGNVSFDGKVFQCESLGQLITISYPEFHIEPQQEQWQTLTILHYLAQADGTPLSGEFITFSQHKDGMVRGGGFDRDVERTICNNLGKMENTELERRCLNLWAKIIPSNADFCAEFSFMPNYPVWLKMWFADEEFPASGRMLLDSSAEHYLTIEDAVTVGTLILDKIKNQA